MKHYNISNVREGIEHQELAIMTARLFAEMQVNQMDVVTKFADKFCRSNDENARKKRRATRSLNREQLDSEPARPGEQIAVRSDNNGDIGYILGNCLDYDPGSQIYEIQDEDDMNRIFFSQYSDVKRLEDSQAHLRRGDDVLAVFPETTSFYKAKVAKNPTPPQHSHHGWDVVVRFEDDEDETGRAPSRRIPGRFVLRRDDVGDE